MRCQKCGYISFDNQEKCKKCRKPVKFDEGLEGVIFIDQPPLFLDLDGDSSGGADSDDAVDIEEIRETEPVLEFLTSEDDQQEMEEIDFGEEDDLQFELELDGGEPDPEVVDLPEDDSIDGSISFDATTLDESLKEEQAEGDIRLDFKDIDISDLDPPEEKSIDNDSADNTDIALGGVDTLPSPTPASGAGLDDLLLDGIDIDSPVPLVAGSRLPPSLKTGTALDDFQVDLGELIREEK